MANYCFNDIRITGNKENLNRLKEEIRVKSNTRGLIHQADLVNMEGKSYDIRLVDISILNMSELMIEMTILTPYKPNIEWLQDVCDKWEVEASMEYIETGVGIGGYVEYFLGEGYSHTKYSGEELKKFSDGFFDEEDEDEQ